MPPNPSISVTKYCFNFSIQSTRDLTFCLVTLLIPPPPLPSSSICFLYGAGHNNGQWWPPPPPPFTHDLIPPDSRMVSNGVPLPHPGFNIPPDIGSVMVPLSPCFNSAGQWDGQWIGTCPIPEHWKTSLLLMKTEVSTHWKNYPGQ